MHPVSTALLLLGYGLAIPIGLQMTKIVQRRHRVALTGHQIGVVLSLLGWVLRGSIIIGAIHLLWLIGVRLWFQLGRPTESADIAS